MGERHRRIRTGDTPKARDTKSHGYTIANNRFSGNSTALQIRDTADVLAIGNQFDAVPTAFAAAGRTPNLAIDPPGLEARTGDTSVPAAITPMPGGRNPFLAGRRRGRDAIVVDEWGPYDWNAPKAWPVLDQPAFKGRDAFQRGALRLRVLGPAGDWRVVSARGARVSAQSGRVGDEVTVTPEVDTAVTDAGRGAAVRLIDYDVAFEYRGGAVVSPRGEKTADGHPYLFHYATFFVPIAWRIRFFDIHRCGRPGEAACRLREAPGRVADQGGHARPAGLHLAAAPSRRACRATGLR